MEGKLNNEYTGITDPGYKNIPVTGGIID